MRGVAGALRVGLRRSRFPLGCVFCFGLCRGMLLMSGIAHRGGGVSFVSAFRGLLFLFFLFQRFLDAGELSQDFLALFLGLAAAGELHGEDLFYDLVELGTAR